MTRGQDKSGHSGTKKRNLVEKRRVLKYVNGIMTTAAELSAELTRIHRAGLINDEEHAVLRGILRSAGKNPKAVAEFERLFPRDVKDLDVAAPAADQIAKLTG